MARAQYAIDLSGVRTGNDGEKPLLGVGRRPRQVLTEAIGGYMEHTDYADYKDYVESKVCKLLLQGVDIDQAVQQGLFETDEIPTVYAILGREPWEQITFDGNKPDYKWNDCYKTNEKPGD